MTVPDPDRPGRPSRSAALPPLGDTIPDPDRPSGPRHPGDPDRPGGPRYPGDPIPPASPPSPPRPEPAGDTLHVVAASTADRLRHLVDIMPGELGDPAGLRARCGAPVEHVLTEASIEQVDCPRCGVAPITPP